MLGKSGETTPSTAVVVERGGSFFVYESNLGIVASDGTLEGAYRKFLEAKQTLLAEADRAGLTVQQVVAASSLPRESAPRSRVKPQLVAGGHRTVGAELGMFAAKTFIVLLVVGAIGGIVALSLGGKPLAMADIADKAADIARDVSSLSPEKKEQFRRSVGVVSRELSPIIDAWRNPPPQ